MSQNKGKESENSYQKLKKSYIHIVGSEALAMVLKKKNDCICDLFNPRIEVLLEMSTAMRMLETTLAMK